MASEANVTTTNIPAVLLITHKACSGHLIKDHPEQPLRVGSIVKALISSFNGEDEMIFDDNPPKATTQQLSRFHTEKHLNQLFQAFDKVAKGGKKNKTICLDGDTTVMKATAEACFRAAGGAVHAVDAVLGPNPRAKSCFVAVRPPGHHAEPDQSMGFCFFGNAGVAALHARAVYGLKRVAILDWDVHHGNGTQARFEDDPDFFFASSHQMPCYPGTGSPLETGVNGNVVNCALRPGSGSDDFRKAWQEVIIPKLIHFQPQLIIVSAGFDAHNDDPLAELRLVDEDFYFVQSHILAAVRGVPLISVLEGGYNIEAISRSAIQCVRAQVEAFSKGSEATQDTSALVESLSNLDIAAINPVGSDDKRKLIQVIMEGYRKCKVQGIIRSDPTTMSYRVLDGELSLLIAFDTKHYAAKRPSQLVAVSMQSKFDPQKFNFNKANPTETIAYIKSTAKFATQVLSLLRKQEEVIVNQNAEETQGLSEQEEEVNQEQDRIHPVLVNVSPLMEGHSVVPLYCQDGLPQLLISPQHFATTCEIAIAAGPSCRVGFNSLGAFASINHLHIHIMPFSSSCSAQEEEDDENDQGFPIENAQPLESISQGYVAVDLLDWHIPSYSFEGQDRAQVTAMAYLLVKTLIEHNIPYNILFIPGRFAYCNDNGEDISMIKIIVIPRQPQELFDPVSSGFNGAVCELCGFLIANSQDVFDHLTETEAVQSLKQGVGLDTESLAMITKNLKVAFNEN